MKQFANATLRVKLILAFLVVSLLPLTILTVWKQQQTRRVLLDRAQQSLLNHTEQTAAVLEQFVTQNLNTVRVEAQLPPLVNYLSATVAERPAHQADVEATFETLIRRDVLNIASYALLDRQGQVLVDTRRENVGQSYGDARYFQQPLNSGFPAISPVLYSAQASEPILYFSSPVRDRGGEVMGVLLLRYRANVLQQMISRAHPDDVAILLDQDELRLAQNNAPDLVLQPIAPLTPQALKTLQDEGRIAPELQVETLHPIPMLDHHLETRDDSPFLEFISEQRALQQAVVVSLPRTQWSLVVAQPQAVFFAPIRAQLRGSILLALASAGLVSLAAIALAYALTRPIAALTTTVGHFAAGELDVRSQVKSQDELGKLAARFNQMAEQIGQLLHNLEDRSQALELSQSTTVAVGELATAIFERERLLHDAVELMQHQFHLERVEVYLWDAEQECLVLQPTHSVDETQPAISCAAKLEPWIEATRLDQKMHSSGAQESAATAVPMVFNETLIGVLELEDPRRSQFSDVERETFKTLANQIAIAWGNAQLIEYIQDAKEQSRQQAQTLEQTLQELQTTQGQLIQSEKMSSLGQLVAGVAHEINNPVSFIYGNLNHLEDYCQSFLTVFDAYQQHYPQPPAGLLEILEDEDIEFTVQDFPEMVNSMRIGADRIKDIVTSLRTFSRLDEADYKAANLHEGLDSTLLILQHRLKANGDRPEIQIIKQYQDLPKIDCFPSQLNQVFMNILANAIDAIEENIKPDQIATIQLKTESLQEQHQVRVVIQDNGPGIPVEIQNQIFNPFFTTKPIGKGTGLGMSISYQIITEKHDGQLECISEAGQGTQFVITLPARQQMAIVP
ncbi:MAG: HAMP domain-containing protein [Spirulina sp. SIO3F2]|nr:HAMP domain-containing protein [Spirulina sp. SIO3F2]